MKAIRYLLLLALAPALNCGGSEPVHRSGLVEQEPLEVALEAAEASPVSRTVELMGTIEARTEASVSAQLLAQIKAAPVQVGDRVTRGQVLFELDSGEVLARLQAAEAARSQAVSGITEAMQAQEAARAGLSSAQAQERLANATYQRFEVLHQRGSVSPQEFDEVRSRRDAARGEVERAAAMLESVRARQLQAEAGSGRAEAEIRQAQTFVGYTRVRAPFSGVVTAKLAEAGDLAAPGVPLARLETQEGYRLAVDVPESQLSSLRLGQQIQVQVPALDIDLAGKVSEIQPGGESASRTFRVKLDLPRHEALHSGLFGRLAIPLGQESILNIPETALVRRGQLDGVFVAGSDGIVRFRLLELGPRLNGRWAVLSGLTAGERIVAAPPDELADGRRVVARQR